MTALTLDTPSHPNFDHRALLHTGPDDLAHRVGAELAEALDRNEPVHVSLTSSEWEAVRDHVGPVLDAATSMPAEARYASPGTAMAALHDFVARAVKQGAQAAWSLGAVRVEGDPDRDARWMRYESAVDKVLAHTPLRGICAYDTTRSPAPVLDAVRSCHTELEDPVAGRHRSPVHQPYDHGRQRWRHRGTTPQVELVVTEPSQVRQELTELLDGTLPTDRLEDLQLIATELVTNGERHGAEPIVLRAWDLESEVVLEVVDHGPGIADPFADLRPRNGGLNGGWGMWLVGQFADQVSIGREGDRTIVMAAMRRTQP